MPQYASVMEEPRPKSSMFLRNGVRASVSVSEACSEALVTSDEHLTRQVYHAQSRFDSDGFLTLTAASLVLLGSGLLAFAFS